MKSERRRISYLWVFLVGFLSFGTSPVFAQQYIGMSGLIHVPSADMDDVGEVRIGGHFLNKKFTPQAFDYNGKYHTTTHYLSITPFSWVELGYTCTLMKGIKGEDSNPDDIGYYHKDRYFSIKIRPLKEKKWYPSIAIGCNDPFSKEKDVKTHKLPDNQFFSNYYLAASKHFGIKGNQLGIHVVYRYWKHNTNSKWNGTVGGITYQPAFQKNLRLIAEYTGDDVNVGFDWKLWKYLLIQSSLQNGKYFSGGVCFCINLL